MLKNKKIVLIPILGFLILISIGAILLVLPISNLRPIAYIDAFFVSASSVCTTGLSTVVLSEQFSFWGQLVILTITQIGALGIVIFIAFLFILLNKKMNFSSVVFFSENINNDNYSVFQKKIKQILRYTFIIEGLGAWLLSFRFIPLYGLKKGLWYSIFHSVMAFCNAGFDLIATNSLIAFKDDTYVITIFIGLILLGGLGFFVLEDLLNCLTHGKPRKISFQSKIVIVATLGITIFAILTMKLLEPTMSIKEAIFASVTLRTAGFYIRDFTQYSLPIQIISMLLMFIGAAPGSTSGGIKLVTITIILLSLKATLSSEDNVNIFYKRISDKTVKMAYTIVTLSAFVVLTGIILLSKTDNFNLTETAFQCISAFSDTGIPFFDNALLSSAGKTITIILMFLGRIGPLSFFTLMSRKSKDSEIEFVEGKLIL